MVERTPDPSEFITARYEVDGPESRARATAERICLDQTIEAEKDLVSPSLQSAILGYLDELRPISGGRYEATIRFRRDLIGGDPAFILRMSVERGMLCNDEPPMEKR